MVHLLIYKPGNPMTCEHRIEGPIIMGLFNVLFEQFKKVSSGDNENSYPLNRIMFKPPMASDVEKSRTDIQKGNEPDHLMNLVILKRTPC